VKIVVNHLTRMQQGYICVSGLKLGTCHHVRPILSGNRLSTGLLRRNGGPFDMAVIVDLGTVKPHPKIRKWKITYLIQQRQRPLALSRLVSFGPC
jgi:hypothetical protein